MNKRRRKQEFQMDKGWKLRFKDPVRGDVQPCDLQI